MRRISLALALVGAVAAAGCSGGAKSSSDAGGNPGVADGFFSVKVTTVGGGVLLTPSVGTPVSCAADTTCDETFPLNTVVTLTKDASVTGDILGWAGDCQGWGECVLSGNADKYVLVSFGDISAATGHPNWSNGALHKQMYTTPPAGFPACTTCHGADLKGTGIAVSCAGCHAAPDPATGGTVPPPNGGHFLATSEAFGDHGTGWSSSCTRCHTDQGFRDYIGVLPYGTETVASDNHLDGTFKASNPNTTCTVATSANGACTDTTKYMFGPLKCETCHNSQFGKTTTVRFVSATVANPLALPTSNTVDSVTGICAQCHQGRESSVSVNAKIDAIGAGTSALPIDNAAQDTVIPTGNSFTNPHYAGAAGTLFGSAAKMWAEYPGKIYTGRNEHGGYASCTFCHDAHTGALPADGAEIKSKCGTCHFEETTGLPVASLLELEESRQFGFEGDIDGDLVQESLKAEIEGLEEILYADLRAYATAKGTSIVYDGAAYPYYFVDANSDGVHDATETTGYNAFTPRSLRAAFNLKWAHAEPGAWAHNPRYVIEVLFDGIQDLNVGLGTPILVTDVYRSFNGHFGGARAAAPYRAFVYSAFPATTGFGSAACYQCHSGKVGLGQYLANPTGASLTTAGKVTGFACNTCHTSGPTMKGIRNDVTTLYFPAQKVAAQQTAIPASTLFPKAADRVCTTCHSGREGSLSLAPKLLDAQGAALPDSSWTLGFTNPHYLGAAGIMFGDVTKMLYQYPGKTYSGNPAFFGSPHGSPHGQSCTGCHKPAASKHSFEVDLASCATCHTGAYDLAPIEAEVHHAVDELYTTMQTYAAAAVTAGVPGANAICYNPSKHPYFYVDAAPANAAGAFCGAEDTVSAKLNPALAKAAFNYKWAKADPGAYAHNEFYVLQALYDSVEALGATPTFTVAAVKDSTTGVPVAGDPLNRGY